MRLVLVSLLCATAFQTAACYDNDDVLGSDTGLVDGGDAGGGSGDAAADGYCLRGMSSSVDQARL